MKVPFFLTVSKGGSVKTTKTRPNLGWDEIAIAVNLELPNALFQKPQLSADIKIPDEAAISTPITADVVNNVQDAIMSATGIEVKLTVINPDEK